MKKHLKQNTIKLMQRGGHCSSYHAPMLHPSPQNYSFVINPFGYDLSGPRDAAAERRIAIANANKARTDNDNRMAEWRELLHKHRESQQGTASTTQTRQEHTPNDLRDLAERFEEQRYGKKELTGGTITNLNLKKRAGGSRHKKRLSLKRNKLQTRNNQNHNSRKTRKTSKTHNTQQHNNHNNNKHRSQKKYT